MKSLVFYVGNLSSVFYDKFSKEAAPLHSILIQESDQFDSGYRTIETLPASHFSEFLTTEKGSELWLSKFYRIQWVSDPSKTPLTVFGNALGIYPEEIQGVIDDVRKHMGDTNLSSPAWQDREYVQHLRFALKIYKGVTTISRILDEDIVPLVLLMRIQFANILSYDHAKYYALAAPGVTLDKSQIHSHYSQVARDLQSSYDSISRVLGRDSGGQNENNVITTMPTPMMGETSRYDSYLGGYVQLSERPKRRRFFQEPGLT